MAETSVFPEFETPALEGVYRVYDKGLSRHYAYWDGVRFGYRAFSPREAYCCRHMSTVLPARVAWSGLTTEGGK